MPVGVEPTWQNHPEWTHPHPLPVGFPGERILQRLIRELATDAATPAACDEIAKSFVEAGRAATMAAFNVLDNNLGPALYQAVQRFVKFQTSMTSMENGSMPKNFYTATPNVMAEQTLQGGPNTVGASPAAGLTLASLTDLYSLFQALNITEEEIRSFGKLVVGSLLMGDFKGVFSLTVTFLMSQLKDIDWASMLSALIGAFTKAAPSGPTIVGT